MPPAPCGSSQGGRREPLRARRRRRDRLAGDGRAGADLRDRVASGRGAVVAAEVGRRQHAGEQHRNALLLEARDDLIEVPFHLLDRQGAQAVVAAELDDDVARLVGEHPVQAGEPAGRGVARDTGVGHPGVDGITFTGSVGTGRTVMRLAADNVTPVVLELGGKSPMVVFDGADLEAAASDLARGLLVNSGQVCIAASRLIVEQSIASELVERLRLIFESKTVGPGSSDPDIAPRPDRTKPGRRR